MRLEPQHITIGSLLLVAGGCRTEAIQSSLHPAGPAAAEIEWLWWFMFSIGTAVLVLVTLLLFVAIFRRPRADPPAPPMGSTRFIVLGGIVFPAVILCITLIYALKTTVSVMRVPDTQLTIQVIGHQWWWEVRYPDHDVITANEIHIPVGEPVRLEVSSRDVIHSFWLPALNGKIDMFPEHVNTFWFQADRAGVFRGQCAEFCGLQHAFMAFMLVAVPRDSFDQWIDLRRQPAPAPATGLQERGLQVFFEAACDNCHAIRGTPASAVIGPDLTDMGSRLTIGAGTVPNTHGNLAGWISNPQPIKPGNRMPPTFLSSEDLHAITAYLASLR